jgi:hypothetical protein
VGHPRYRTHYSVFLHRMTHHAARSIRLERERLWLLQSPQPTLWGGVGTVGKSDETGRMSGLLVAVLDRDSAPAGER